MPTPTHYDTLGVPRDATAAEIKRAYRKLASEHHPDRGGDKARSAAVNDAYACLSDSARRAHYDAHGDVPVPKTPAEEQAERVRNCFHETIRHALQQQPGDSSVITKARTLLSSNITAVQKALAQGQADITRLRGIAARVRRKTEGEDVVADILAQQILERETMIASGRSAEEAMRDVFRMLADDYEETPEECDLAPAFRVGYSWVGVDLGVES